MVAGNAQKRGLGLAIGGERGQGPDHPGDGPKLPTFTGRDHLNMTTATTTIITTMVDTDTTLEM